MPSIAAGARRAGRPEEERWNVGLAALAEAGQFDCGLAYHRIAGRRRWHQGLRGEGAEAIRYDGRTRARARTRGGRSWLAW
ncbi:MAG: hypothetical protein EXR63_04735 [Dehalococcoidia bacterium]|nr:hypothetical protein [Dehalococcoidia bacterium]